MRGILTLASVIAAVLGIAAVAVSVVTRAPNLGFRIVACVLLIDQSTLTLLYLRLPVEVRPLTIALRIGAALAMAAGALIIVWSALPRAGGGEIAMPAVAAAMIVHGALTLRALATSSAPESP
jgi:hypothetical protein